MTLATTEPVSLQYRPWCGAIVRTRAASSFMK